MSAWISWRQAWREAETEMVRTADAAAEYARRVLDGLVLRVDRANEILAGLSDAEIRANEERLHAALRRVVERTGDAGTIHLLVLDRDAAPLVSANVFPLPHGVSFAQREHMPVLRGPAPPEIHVSAVQAGLLIGRSFFILARRRGETGNGLPPDAFDGVVSAAILSEEVGAALRALAGDPRDSLALLRSDGAVLVATDGFVAEGAPARLPDGDPALERMRRGEERGLDLAPTGPGGAPRITAIRQVAGYPVHVAVARPTAELWSRWRRGLVLHLAIGVPAMISLGLLALALVRRQHALADANATLEQRLAERTAELERRSAEAAELAEALELTPVLVRRLDGSILFWSRGCEQLYGYSAAEAVGRCSHVLLATTFPASGGPAAALAALEACGEWRGELLHRHRDGHVVAVLSHWVLRRRPGGGEAVVVEANTDIAALRRAEAEREEARALLAAALDAADMGTWQYDPATGLMEVSEGADRLFGLPDAGPAGPRPLADYLAALHPDDRARVRHQIELAAALGQDVALEYRVRRPGGTLRWIVSRGGLRTRGDWSQRLMGALVDVTVLKRAQEALARSEARLRLAQEAGGIGTWEWDAATGELHWSRETFLIFGLDPDRDRPLGYARTLEWVHPEDRGAIIAAARKAFGEDGQFAAEFRLLRRGPRGTDLGETRWAVARGRRLAGPDGRRGRLIGAVVDITDRKLAEERLMLLMREVDHRAKNALAVVQAALRLTPKDDARAYAAAVEGRVKALARAHTLLAQSKWAGTGLRSLLQCELAPFLDGTEGEAAGPRVVLAGPPVTLPPQVPQPLGTSLHELATNATKYGALSVPEGCVRVSWTLLPRGWLRLRWEETGGPALRGAPARTGFGSRVLLASIQDQLGGRVERRWEESGLVCTIEIPIGEPSRRADGGEAARPASLAASSG